MDRSQTGQVLLIVTLTMILALTVGLAVVSRSITNLKISKQNEESERALRAAQSGIEKALKQAAASQTISGSFQANQAKFTTSTTPTTANPTQVNLKGGDDIPQSVGTDVWLSTYPDFTAPQYSGTVTVYWGTSSQSQCSKSQGSLTTPALEIVALLGAKATPSVQKFVYDGCSARTPGATSVTAGTFPVLGTTYRYSAAITIPAGAPGPGLIMKVIPLYNSTKIGVVGLNPLPNQGFRITSTGTSGDATRTITYFNAYPQIPPEIFPYSIISQ